MTDIERFEKFMKEKYPNLRLDSVTAQIYKEIFLAARESTEDK